MIDELLEKVEENGSDRLNLFFITRTLKEGVKAKNKVLEKYQFTVYSVDIDDEIKGHLYDLTCNQFKYIIKKELDTTEYDVITDDLKRIFTYSIKNKAMSFADVVNNQLNNKSQITKIKDLTSLVGKEELWAYCVGFFNAKNDWFYTFRKILKGKVVVEEEGKNSKKKVNFFRAKFDTVSSKLEMLHGETINLDEKIDCIYNDGIFYIIQKTQFEQITCISEEFKERAKKIVEELINTGLINGTDLLKRQVIDKPTIHKKLVRLQKTNNYQNLKKTDINKMLRVAKRFGGKLKKDTDGNLLLETEQDIELTIRVLADFYKKGEFSGKPYGTFSGKQLKESE